jgi:protein-tyrosine phosphatase
MSLILIDKRTHGCLYISGLGEIFNNNIIHDLEINSVASTVLLSLEEKQRLLPFLVSNTSIEEQETGEKNKDEEVMRISHLYVPIKHEKDDKIQLYFDSVANFIDEALLRGENILVHCRHGVSRAVTFVAYYLMKYYSFDVRNAVQYIKTHREFADPREEFIQKLYEAQNKLHNK